MHISLLIAILLVGQQSNIGTSLNVIRRHCGRSKGWHAGYCQGRHTHAVPQAVSSTCKASLDQAQHLALLAHTWHASHCEIKPAQKHELTVKPGAVLATSLTGNHTLCGHTRQCAIETSLPMRGHTYCGDSCLPNRRRNSKAAEHHTLLVTS